MQRLELKDHGEKLEEILPSLKQARDSHGQVEKDPEH